MRIGISKNDRFGKSWVQIGQLLARLKQVDVGDGKMAGVAKDDTIWVANGDLKNPANVQFPRIDGAIITNKCWRWKYW